MKTVQECNQPKEILLAQRTEHVKDLCICYRLELSHGYRIRVSVEQEESLVAVGSDLERAWAFFCAVANGRVTPCTLSDVWEDFCSPVSCETGS